jgi:NADH-quinone oxidoreductase subunit J
VSALLAASDVNVAQNVAFGVIAAAMIFAAFCVVTTSNVVHAALCLVVVLGGMAAQYILATAEFVAASQVLVYIGAVMVLFLFGIMLTRAQIGREQGLNNPGRAIGIPVAVLLFGLLSWVIIDAYGDDVVAEPAGPTPTEALSDSFLSSYLFPFLALSFVLLAAAIGAIVLARKD